MTQFKFTSQQKKNIDTALRSLIRANNGYSVLVSLRLSSSVLLDIRAHRVGNNCFLSMLITFNLHSYSSKDLLEMDLEYYRDINPTISFKTSHTFYSYLDDEKMMVVDLEKDENKSLIIKSWQNLTKSQSESPAEESAFNQKSCQTSKKQTE